MIDEMDPREAAATLEWLIEMGCDEAIAARPLNRYALPDRMPPGAAAPTAPVPAPTLAPVPDDPVRAAGRTAAAASTMEELRAAIARYPHCDSRLGARGPVFAEGLPGARVMIVGDAPDREEDRAGRPFVGPAGDLLDKMLAAIGLSRTSEDPSRAVATVPALPWRLSARDPDPAELAMTRPFLHRAVELAAPEILICMGNHACDAVLGERGVTRLRGTWTTGFDRPVLPMLPPAFLLRQPAAKRDAWADLLDLAARLDL